MRWYGCDVIGLRSPYSFIFSTTNLMITRREGFVFREQRAPIKGIIFPVLSSCPTITFDSYLTASNCRFRGLKTFHQFKCMEMREMFQKKGRTMIMKIKIWDSSDLLQSYRHSSTTRCIYVSSPRVSSFINLRIKLSNACPLPNLLFSFRIYRQFYSIDASLGYPFKILPCI